MPACSASSRSRLQLALALAAALAATAACSHSIESEVAPRPALAFAPPSRAGAFMVEIDAVVAVNESIAQRALEHPPLSELVDLQIAAMERLTRERGRGDEARQTSPDAEWVSDDAVARELARLRGRAAQLAGSLNLESGSRELAQVALAGLARRLGASAQLVVEPPGDVVASTDLALDLRDGVGYLALRRLTGDVAERVAAVLSQWSAGTPPRALVLDLARCELGSPSSASALVQLLAPGKPAFELELLDEQTRKRVRRRYRGDADFGTHAYAQTPLFVVTSARTGSFAEAVARALRGQRGASVLGSAPASDGRVLAWTALPWNARFGVTVGQLYDDAGRPLRDSLLVPDACMSQAQLVAVPAHDPGRYHELCTGDETLPAALAIDYARTALDAVLPAPQPPSEDEKPHA